MRRHVCVELAGLREGGGCEGAARPLALPRLRQLGHDVPLAGVQGAGRHAVLRHRVAAVTLDLRVETKQANDC